jgi:XRE family transcriptional regulator, regulator of sulfur utilization
MFSARYAIRVREIAGSGKQTVGNSLRFLREQRGISLRALAERTDFSASFLSQIENGQCSPSISSMEKIANALGVTLGQFFLSADQEAVTITRASDRAHKPLDWSRADIASLGSLSNGSQFRASMLSIKPGGLTEKHAIPSASDEFAMVFEGRVVLQLKDTEQVLERGDSVTVVAGTRRQWRNESNALAEILVVSLGPYR